MFKKIRKNWPQTLLGIVIFSLLVGFLFWHYRLALTRYFDIDEYAYLHWGYSLSIGERPYTDFSFLIPPFFLYPIAAIHKIFGRNLAAIIGVRVFIFFIFLVTTLTVFLLASKLRNPRIGLLTAFFFAYLPMPFDKMIEIRPDLVALLFSLLGLYFFFLRWEKEKKYTFLTSFFLVTSLGFMPKAVFTLLIVMAVLGYKLYETRGSPDDFHSAVKGISIFFLGALPPVLFFLLLIFSYGNPLFALLSITKTASAVVSILGAQFFTPPDFFFRQNDVYYGISGYSLPYLVNLGIYWLAILWGIGRFISSLSYPERNKCIRELVVGSTFFVNLIAYIKFYPLKHSQYLIFTSPFIAFYMADFLDVLISRISFIIDAQFSSQAGILKVLKLAHFAGYIILLAFLAVVGKNMNEIKLARTNENTLQEVVLLLKTIPADSPVFDLTGKSIFFPNGYYYCCLPYGQYAEILPKIPDLELELKKRGTKYVYIHWPDRLNSIPRKQIDYIKNNFENYLPDGSLLIKK